MHMPSAQNDSYATVVYFGVAYPDPLHLKNVDFISGGLGALPRRGN